MVKPLGNEKCARIDATGYARLGAYAFTLLELLVVIAVIAILAALLLPVLSRVKVKVKTENVRMEMGQIATAINEYQSAFNRFPVSAEIANSVAALEEDYTYGGTFYGATGKVTVAGPGAYLKDNHELMAVLLDLEYYGNGQPTINNGHVKNPQRTKYLSPHLAMDTNSAGVGPDGAYRDPWGLPYMITLDLNLDGTARDIFYRSPAISQDPGNPNQGLNGLVRKTDAQGNPTYEANVPVLVWSPGPDKHINTDIKANLGENKDNILSWKR